MIHVDRSTVAMPRILQSEVVKQELARAAQFFAQDQDARAQRRYDFQARIYMSHEVREALLHLFHGKCAFCESEISAANTPDVEQFRPKMRAMNLDGSTDPDHYWWLAYEWTNLYLVCQPCNRMKAGRFPVRGRRAAQGQIGDALVHENALLLDPCLDEPSEHFVFTEQGEVVSSTERGRITIDILNLNRGDLVSLRAGVLDEISAHFKHVERLRQLVQADPADEDVRALLSGELRALGSHVSLSRPYAGMRRQVISNWLQRYGVDDIQEGRALRDLILNQARFVPVEEQQAAVRGFQEHQKQQQVYSVEENDDTNKEAYFSAAKRLERIEIRDFKAIESLDLVFPPPQELGDESWLMLLGENGTGKSSVLQAVALTLMGQRHANAMGLDASRFLRRGAAGGAGSVRVFLTGINTPIELHFRRDDSQFAVFPPDPKVLLLGYGSTRLLPRPRGAHADEPKYVRIQNLFDPTAPLNDAEAWLGDEQGMSQQKFDQIALALKDLLLLDGDDFLSRQNGTVVATAFGAPVALRELSDGFQSVVALCCDIMISLSERWPSMQDAEGIVMIDEIEVHLHPSWKIQLVERLRRVFPRVSFLVTTHDPLCLRGLYDGEIAILRRGEEDRIVAQTNIPPIDHLRADQILTLLFDLPTTRGSATVGMIARYSELLGKSDKTELEQAEFEEMRSTLSGSITYSETPMQREVEQAVRSTLAEQQPLARTRSLPDVSALSPEVELELKRQLSELLK